MTTAQMPGRVPEWTLADRLRKARESAALDQGQLADRIGVTRKTISDAERGRRRVREITLNAWSMATGVSRQWLLDGTIPPDGPLAQLAELRTFNPKYAAAPQMRDNSRSPDTPTPTAA